MNKATPPPTPQKKWLPINAPDGYSWWEYQDGDYSATLFESHQEAVKKKEVSVYFKGSLLNDNVFFLSPTGPRKAAADYIERHREESKPKKVPTIFEQARRAISHAKNRKESEAAASLFHGLANSGKITREEEQILEAFLVLKVGEFIREREISIRLPSGESSWFGILARGDERNEQREIDVSSTGGLLYDAEFSEIEIHRYNLDFVKARAMDEISEFLPDSAEEISQMAYRIRHETRMSNESQESPIEKKLFAMLRFYGKNDIRRN